MKILDYLGFKKKTEPSRAEVLQEIDIISNMLCLVINKEKKFLEYHIKFSILRKVKKNGVRFLSIGNEVFYIRTLDDVEDMLNKVKNNEEIFKLFPECIDNALLEVGRNFDQKNKSIKANLKKLLYYFDVDNINLVKYIDDCENIYNSLKFILHMDIKEFNDLLIDKSYWYGRSRQSAYDESGLLWYLCNIRINEIGKLTS